MVDDEHMALVQQRCNSFLVSILHQGQMLRNQQSSSSLALSRQRVRELGNRFDYSDSQKTPSKDKAKKNKTKDGSVDNRVSTSDVSRIMGMPQYTGSKDCGSIWGGVCVWWISFQATAAFSVNVQSQLSEPSPKQGRAIHYWWSDPSEDARNRLCVVA